MIPGSASIAGSAAASEAFARSLRAAVGTLPSVLAAMPEMRERGRAAIATSAASPAVPRSARRRAGEGGRSGSAAAACAAALGRTNASETRKVAAPAAASMTLVTGSIFDAEKSCARTTLATQGTTATATTVASRRRGATARSPVIAPSAKNNATTPTMSSHFAQYWSSSMSGMLTQPGRTSMIA